MVYSCVIIDNNQIIILIHDDIFNVIHIYNVWKLYIYTYESI